MKRRVPVRDRACPRPGTREAAFAILPAVRAYRIEEGRSLLRSARVTPKSLEQIPS
jgi:hypothetical protein